MVAGENLNLGQSLDELRDSYGVQLDTLLEHLTQYALEGRGVRTTEEFQQRVALPPEMQAKTLAAFAELGPDKLRPVYDRLNGLVNYDELKVCA